MAVLVSDSFNRAANASSLGSTDSYAGGTSKPWTVSGTGAYGIDSTGQYAYCSTAPSSGHNVAYVDAGISDGEAQVTFNTLDDYSGGGPKISFRIQDSENMINCQVMTTSIDVYYYQNGTANELLTWNGTVKNGDTVKVQAKGTSIIVFLNGTQVLSTTDTSPFTKNTKWGIMAYHYQTARFDNFMVSDFSMTGSASIKTGASANENVAISLQGSASVSTGASGTWSTSSMTGSASISTGATANENVARKLQGSASVSTGASGSINILKKLPSVNKIVVVVMENHSLSEIEGSASAPYMNSLMQQGANFHNYFAIEHPSQPNYLDIVSGTNQGCTDDNYITSYSINAPNLYSVLNAAGKSVVTYSEDMDKVGSTVDTYNNYASKHNPLSKFSNVPPSTNMPFAGYYPPSSYSSLSDVSIIVPNLQDDIHDGTIAQGDTWLKNNIDPYLQWAKANNSLLIVVFDEDDAAGGNNLIPFFMVGTMVKQMTNTTTYNHYSLLRTLIDLKGGSSYPGNSATATTISDAWITVSLSGSASVSTGASGSIRESIGLQGSASITEGDSGAITVTAQTGGTSVSLSGSASISVSTSGAINEAITLRGTSSIQTGANGSEKALRSLTGSTQIKATANGNENVHLALTGSAAITVNAQGNGTGSIVSLSGSSSIQTSASGVGRVTRGLTGSSSSTVTTSGDDTLMQKLSGSSNTHTDTPPATIYVLRSLSSKDNLRVTAQQTELFRSMQISGTAVIKVIFVSGTLRIRTSNIRSIIRHKGKWSQLIKQRGSV